MPKLAVRLGLISSLNLLASFVAQWWTLVFIGPGGQTDALYAGLAVPQVLLLVVTGSLGYVLVPLLAGKPPAKVREHAWGFFILIGGIFGTISLVLAISAGNWVPLLVPGFSAELRSLTVELTRIQLGGMPFAALAAVVLAVYRAKHHFIWPELAQLAVAVAAVGALFWALPKMGITSAAWIFSIRPIVLVLLLVPVLKRYKSPDWSDAAFRTAWQRIKPVLAGTTYYKSGPLVDRYLSSFAPVGSPSILFFGLQVLDAVHGIVNRALTTPLMTRLADAARQQAWRKFRRLYRMQVVLVTATMTVGILVLLVVGKEVLRLFVGHGSVTEENVNLLWLLLILMSGYLIGGGLGQPLSVAFYAIGETKVPTAIGVAGFTVGVILKVVLFFRWGLPGIALGLTAHHIFNGLAFLFCVERAIKKRIDGTNPTA